MRSIGPGFASAYGLVMLRHDRELRSEDGLPSYADTVVRSHGSVNYRSVLSGQSHGCHRLFNHLALRLASFLLSHRDHVHHGMLRTRYARTVHYQNVHRTLRIQSRGYGYELTPPVPLVVTEGHIRSRRKRPIEADLPLPPGLSVAPSDPVLMAPRRAFLGHPVAAHVLRPTRRVVRILRRVSQTWAAHVAHVRVPAL
jgi:hypothetical protein